MMDREIDRNRLARVLGMLGSAHDGEVVAAARAAEQIRRDAGATWFDILESQPQPLTRTADDQTRLCREWPDLLNSWEHRFVFSLRYQSRLSPKQPDKLCAIADKVERIVGGCQS